MQNLRILMFCTISWVLLWFDNQPEAVTPNKPLPMDAWRNKDTKRQASDVIDVTETRNDQTQNLRIFDVSALLLFRMPVVATRSWQECHRRLKQCQRWRFVVLWVLNRCLYHRNWCITAEYLRRHSARWCFVSDSYKRKLIKTKRFSWWHAEYFSVCHHESVWYITSIVIKMLLTQDSCDRSGKWRWSVEKVWTEMGARWFLIGFDRRGLIARLSEFFWTRDWESPPLWTGPSTCPLLKKYDYKNTLSPRILSLSVILRGRILGAVPVCPFAGKKLPHPTLPWNKRVCAWCYCEGINSLSLNRSQTHFVVAMIN